MRARSLAPVLGYLRSVQVAPPQGQPVPGTPLEALLGAYRQYLEGERGVSAGTVRHYLRYARAFLAGLPEPLSRALAGLLAGQVTGYSAQRQISGALVQAAAGERPVVDGPAAAPTATYRRPSPRPLHGDPRPPSRFCQSHLMGFLVAGRDAPSPRRGAGWSGPGKSAAVQSPCRRGNSRVEGAYRPLRGQVRSRH